MPLRVNIDVLGEEVISRSLLRVHERLEDMSPVWDEIDVQLTKAEEKQFATQGAYGSGGWTPLAESTRRRKAAAGLDNGILRATGRLKRSLTVTADAEHVYVGQADSMTWGTTVPYARYHQDGSGSSLPRRRVVQLPEAERRNVVRTMQRGILAVNGGLG